MMSTLQRRTIKIGNRKIEAYRLPLVGKNLIILKGSKGYIMCGYLNLSVAEKFKDAAIKIKGVSTIDDALRAHVDSCTAPARALGVKKSQAIKDVLRIIA